MACKTEERKIGAHTWSVTQMLATEAVLWHAELGAVIADVLAPMLSETVPGTGRETALRSLAAAFRANLSPERFQRMVLDLVCSEFVYCDGMKMDKGRFDATFSGEYLVHLYDVVGFVLEVNFGDFLAGLLQHPLLETRTPPESKSDDSPQT